MTRIVDRAYCIPARASQPSNVEAKRGIDRLVTGILHERGLEPNHLQGLADDLDVVVGIVQGADLVGIALIADEQRDARLSNGTCRPTLTSTVAATIFSQTANIGPGIRPLQRLPIP